MKKRLFDVAVSTLGLVLLAPVMAMIALAILLEEGPPVLYSQTRVGRAGRHFRILKFRSMRTGVAGMRITASNDRRVTRVGRFLRKYKLDELPQLWNVARGDMSLIGPRPELPDYVEPEDPLWRQVLQVRPGITDLATLVFRNEETLLAAAPDADQFYRGVILPKKLALNLEYIRTASASRDARLILLTLWSSSRPESLDAAAVERHFLRGNAS